MGCDIHLYVEYRRRGNAKWNSFGGRIDMPRIYGMFAKLADVRNDFGIIPIAPPRGIPADMDDEAFSGYTMYITEDGGDDYASKENAAKWVENGTSVYMRDDLYISNPDWHSASWCNADELESAIKEVWAMGSNEYDLPYCVVADMLRSLEKRGQEARIVFWFDN